MKASRPFGAPHSGEDGHAGLVGRGGGRHGSRLEAGLMHEPKGGHERARRWLERAGGEKAKDAREQGISNLNSASYTN